MNEYFTNYEKQLSDNNTIFILNFKIINILPTYNYISIYRQLLL